jgi:cell pole-organizing protein PopZ
MTRSRRSFRRTRALQIARSFEELAAAIDGAERRSLDEIAEDMLRPMLRDWLDDNLPTLVERLVREEIERVARGPRR